MSTKKNERPTVDMTSLMLLAVNDMIPDPNQPRKRFRADTIAELGKSLAETGQVSPIVVRPGPAGKYLIVAGERRWRAAKDAGIHEIECIARRDIDNQKAIEIQLAENFQREDLTPLEQARAIKAYLDTYKVSQSGLSRRTGIPQRTISARIALLSLPASMHARIERGEIGPHEAILISKLPSSYQSAVITRVTSGKLGGRALERLCTTIKANPNVSIDDTLRQIQYVADKSPGEVTQTPTSSVANIREPSSAVAKSSLSEDLSRDLASLIEIVKWRGICEREDCGSYRSDGRCLYWEFESGETIPEAIQDHSHLKSSDGSFRPSLLLCGICSGEDACAISYTQQELFADPLMGLRKRFRCNCGAAGLVAAHVKCTNCGKETWEGFWLK